MQPGAFPSKARIQWPRGNQSSTWTNLDQELSTTLAVRLKGSTVKQLGSFCEIAYDMCLERFGEEESRKKSEIIQQPNRRQVRKGQLRMRQRQLKRQLNEAPDYEKPGIQALLDDIKHQILVLSRAENHRKRRKKKRRARESFYRNPYAFAKKLFSAAKSGRLDIPQDELEAHLACTYSDPLKDIPLTPMDGIPLLEEPEVPFRTGGYRQSEARDFIRKARAGSAPGFNGISFKLYKNCPTVLEQLIGLLQRAWREGLVMQEWCLADGVWIPKEENSVGVGNFRPISLLNVEGKIFFGVLARRMTSFLLLNKYINTSVQKAGIPGFPGCLEHAQMIWNSLMAAKRERKELHVVWLDLANAYGSVPHTSIKLALEFFHVPEKVIDILMQYFGNAFMRFTTNDYTTSWQAMEIGIMMGCVISPLLFVMCMELILRGTEETVKGEETSSGCVLPPSRAFMDDVTTLIQSKEGTQQLLDRFYNLFTWTRMKAKPKKSRSISLIRGKVQDIHFSIGGDIIPTVREQPVKSLGRLYACPLTDRHRGMEVQKTALEGLTAIDKSDLPGKLKVWCFQHGLLPRLLWPLQIYEISLSRVETIQQLISKHLRRWLGVPPCFSTVGLYTTTGMLQLPLSSVVEEFKVGKARLHMMLRDSPDDVIRHVQPEVRTGIKWSAAKATQVAEASLQIKEVIGATQTGRAGLGSTPHQWFSKEDNKGRRGMVITELRMIEEEKRTATAAGQAKQCAWMKWEGSQARKLSWSSLMTSESLALSFLLRSTYDLLPTPANCKQWGYTGDDTCATCKSARGTLRHVLSACKSSLQMYTWRHNQVLAILAELTAAQCEVANQQAAQHTRPVINFFKEGDAPPQSARRPQGLKLLAGAMDWKTAADLKEALHFPIHIVQTRDRPDIVVWSDSARRVLLVELTVPWEENMDEAFERKKTRYETLRTECEDKEWACHVMPIEVGCRGFLGRTTTSYLTNLGLKSRAKRNATQRLQEAAEQASSWIWSKAHRLGIST